MLANPFNRILGGTMKSILIILAALTFSSLSQAATCTAVYQTINDKDLLEETSADLQVETENAAFVRSTADIGDFHFFAQQDKKSQNFLLIISIGPDYKSGATAALTWDENNMMRLTRVDGDDVYKLVCKK